MLHACMPVTLTATKGNSLSIQLGALSTSASVRSYMNRATGELCCWLHHAVGQKPTTITAQHPATNLHKFMQSPSLTFQAIAALRLDPVVQLL